MSIGGGEVGGWFTQYRLSASYSGDVTSYVTVEWGHKDEGMENIQFLGGL